MTSSIDPSVLRLPSRLLSLGRVVVMGVLNRTPDSFYPTARHADLDHALQRAWDMIEQGAGIVDIGGEKAGPGEPVPLDEELQRVIPMIEHLRRESDIPISVDTLKPAVARAAVEAGADFINSIGGFESAEMRRVAAQTGAAIVIMHIQGRPRVPHPNPHYDDVVAEVRAFLERRIADCIADGIASDRIILDPGPGFGKTAQHDLAIIRGLGSFTSLPYPVLLAVSRKPFIGYRGWKLPSVAALPPGATGDFRDPLGMLHAPIEERLEGSLAVAAWGVLNGVRIVRAHDVRATKRVCLMTEAVLRPELVDNA